MHDTPQRVPRVSMVVLTWFLHTAACLECKVRLYGQGKARLMHGLTVVFGAVMPNGCQRRF